ncbi:(2Fe-2S)-binding protein [Scopulibacillus cellulosilyticus]|uniref:(2Fe-2S)-binding protein n=1 Tax=Scopulibacillus cellulosilyticus TaxID=2665665 RepID=A0ABW2Q5K9_9BACL
MDKSTIICRCEEINIDELETAMRLGTETFDDIKRMTRCGMGPCQSKICMNLVNKLISDFTGNPISDILPARMRMPLRITRIGTLAGDLTEETSVISVFNETDTEEGSGSHG